MPEIRKFVYHFSIPGIKGKARPRSTRTGQVYTPAETTLYENLVRMTFRDNYRNAVPGEGNVTSKVIAKFGIPKSWPRWKKEAALQGLIRPVCKPDIDNISKIILDSLNGYAYRDDSHVVEESNSKIYIDGVSEVEIYLEVMEEEWSKSNEI